MPAQIQACRICMVLYVVVHKLQSQDVVYILGPGVRHQSKRISRCGLVPIGAVEAVESSFQERNIFTIVTCRVEMHDK